MVCDILLIASGDRPPLTGEYPHSVWITVWFESEWLLPVLEVELHERHLGLRELEVAENVTMGTPCACGSRIQS